MADTIVLETLPLCKVVVDRDFLTSKMKDYWSDEELREVAESSGIGLTGLKNMTVIAYIKADIASKRNRMGYARYREVLKKEGFDV